ncbi:MAG TPA: hypothetical protein VLM90_14915, partial [Candidatus Deferrimicrobium sp.]|nr:hypothetical protein [Candidatus Deferrimicrobium sp.]
QTVGKAAGRRADVKRNLIFNVDGELTQGLFEFEAAAADVERRSLDTDLSTEIDQATDFGHGLIIDEDFASDNFAPAFFPAANQLALDQEKI